MPVSSAQGSVSPELLRVTTSPQRPGNCRKSPAFESPYWNDSIGHCCRTFCHKRVCLKGEWIRWRYEQQRGSVPRQEATEQIKSPCPISKVTHCSRTTHARGTLAGGEEFHGVRRNPRTCFHQSANLLHRTISACGWAVAFGLHKSRQKQRPSSYATVLAKATAAHICLVHVSKLN